MKKRGPVAFATRPQRRAIPLPAKLPPPLSFTCPNFVDGQSITYTLTRDGYVFQVRGHKAVHTGEMRYPAAAAKARAKYGLPAIGSASHAKEIAA